MTTTFALRIREELENESRRMINEWFFLWHQIGGSQVVEIDGFDGRKISYCGLHFFGSPREVYWSTLRLYFRKIVAEKYDALQLLLLTMPSSQKRATVTETKDLLSSFTKTLVAVATAQDRTMRGNGVEFPLADVGRAEALSREILLKIDERNIAISHHYELQSRFRMIEERLGEYPNISKLLIGLGCGGLLSASATALLHLIR
ncbi:hypothetical protein [Rhodopseudomonas sp. RCAM05734]|uniref:hypothetical protein n=1 Tax=Rhodopseudomonas sp. RCAM05734 TaxID=3457549 RepID=UPI004044E790